jgi:exportin-7
MRLFGTALAGNYVNFGVFELYGDRALADALDVALKMTLSIPLADIMAFRKVKLCLFARKLVTVQEERLRPLF